MKFVYVVSLFDTFDMRVSTSGCFDTAQEAEQYWWDTVQKNLEKVQNGFNYHVESLRVA